MGEIEDVMTLLAISIVADRRVTKEELDVFKKAVAQVQFSNFNLKPPSEEAAVEWFAKYHADIRTIAFGAQPAFETRLTDLLDRLDSHIRPEALLHTLHMISIADGELHENEARLISFIKHHGEMED